MKRLPALIILGSVMPLLAHAADDKDTRVRAKEPTVVTVRGSADAVQTQTATPQQRSVGGKVVHGIKTGALTAVRGVTAFAGWIANTDDDIPSEQERSRTEQTTARKP